MKRSMAFLLVAVLCIGLCACGGASTSSDSNEAAISVAASQCKELIERIGTVTAESGDAIEAAEKAYNALDDADKAQIAVAAADLQTARKTFDTIVREAESQAKVDNVIALIDAIGAVTLNAKSAVDEAQAAYDALTKEEQGKVTNAAALESARTALTKLVQAEKDKVIKEYTKKFDKEVDKVEGITWYQPKNMPEYIDIRSYIIPYIGVRNDGAWVCIRYNYTADDWIFWENLKIVVDGKTYTKSVGYYNTVRDNDTEIWEYYDEVLDVNQAMDSSQLTMLADIAASDETIIRFQGDDYHYDLYVTKEDKNMIKDVLKLYEAMLP